MTSISILTSILLFMLTLYLWISVNICQHLLLFFSSLILYFFGFSIKVICLYKWIEDYFLFYIPYKILKNIEIVYFLNKK